MLVVLEILDGLESESWHPFNEFGERKDQETARVDRYLEERGRKLIEPVMAALEPVQDWSEDFEIFDPEFVRDPYPIWQDLRAQPGFAKLAEKYGSRSTP